ncbi:hypothetical protein CRG98_000729 [Punica granatum]|uniref:Uncharacterized protein n=1 Tax=Punica granatum TaxID=22663 RepID=A0A2I0LDX3_PUNGR|nr:hypothetical protein CRG98_000729 [Punica granatum]
MTNVRCRHKICRQKQTTSLWSPAMSKTGFRASYASGTFLHENANLRLVKTVFSRISTIRRQIVHFGQNCHSWVNSDSPAPVADLPHACRAHLACPSLVSAHPRVRVSTNRAPTSLWLACMHAHACPHSLDVHTFVLTSRTFIQVFNQVTRLSNTSPTLSSYPEAR